MGLKKLRVRFDHSDLTVDDLRRIQASEPRNPSVPQELALSEIKVADSVFQWRDSRAGVWDREEHVRQLARALSSQRSPLDPILVTAIGSEFFVIDGHHRLAAYHAAGWTAPVPVSVFEGSLEDAWTEGLAANKKDKLPLTRQEKQEAAWKLVKAQRTSKAQEIALTGVAEGIIAKMRRTLKARGS